MRGLNRNTGRTLVIAVLALVFAWYLFSGRSADGGVTVRSDSPNQHKTIIQTSAADTVRPDNVRVAPAEIPVAEKYKPDIDVKAANPANLVAFAKTLIGVPYVYASSDPAVGFDCSGFITYVFKHFNIQVPRSSIDFSNIGKTIEPEKAKQGDLILFTGTNELERHVGHMGIIVSNEVPGGIEFIHATSGKAMSVTISQMTDQYVKRFVRVCRVF